MFRGKRGFTLLELITTLVILAILASLAVPTFNTAIKRSKLKVAEVTAAAFTRETIALAALEGRSTLEEADALTAAADLPSPKAYGEGVWADAPFVGYQVVFGGLEFSGNKQTISASLSADKTKLGVAVIVPGAGCAYARSTSNQVQSWSKMDVEDTSCSGAAALVHSDGTDPVFSPPPVPSGLNLSFGMCGSQPGWIVNWTSGSVDIYVNGRYVGDFTGSACLAGTDPSDTIKVVERDPSTPAGEPSTWPGSPVTEGNTNSGGSDDVPTTPPGPTTPVTGTAPSVTPSPGETVKISWNVGDLPSGTTSIVITRSSGSGGGGGSTSFTSTDVSGGSYYDSSAPSGVSASYTAQPVINGTPAGSAISIGLTRVTTPSTVPNADPNVHSGGPGLSVDGLNALLYWGAVADTAYAPLNGYKIYGANSATGPWLSIADTPKTVTTYALLALSPGTHCYALSAWGPGGESAKSAAVCANFSAAVGTKPTAAPTGVTPLAGNGQVTVSWTGVPAGQNGGSAIAGYKVVIDPAPADGVTVKTVNASTSSLTVTGLTNLTPYTFKVSAVNGVGEGPSLTSPPVVPAANVTTFTSNSTWTVPQGVTSVTVNALGGGLRHGGTVVARIPVIPGETYYIHTGANGASDLRTAGNALADRILVAGAAGSDGKVFMDNGKVPGTGGVGGAVGGIGGPGGGVTSYRTFSGGLGGTQTGGYSKGSGGPGGYVVEYYYVEGGRGGDGYWGGYGGEAGYQASPGGGGGSSYLAPGLTLLSSVAGGNTLPNASLTIAY